MKIKRLFLILFITLYVTQALAACGTGTPVVPTSKPTDIPAAHPTLETTVPVIPEPTAVPSVEFVQSILGNPNPLSKPVAVALDAQGNLYVLEAGSSRVQVFDHNGQFLRTWGSPGAGDGQFNLINPKGAALAADGYPGLEHYGDIAVDSNGNVYVLDTFNYRVQKFAPNGTFLAKWGQDAAIGTAPDGQFRLPAGITTDVDGNVYVSDGGRPDTQKFDPNGNLLSKIGGSSMGDNQISLWGSSIAVSPEGLIYVSDYGSERIQVFGSDGQFLRQWTVREVWGIDVDREGNVYATLSTKSSIVKFDAEGKILLSWGERGGDDGQFRQPMGVVIDSNGLIYVADYDNDRVQVFRQPTSTVIGMMDPAAGGSR